MSIIKTCLVVNVQLGMWQGHKLDKVTTSKVTRDAGASSDAARVSKHLIPKDALRDIAAAASAVRAHFYDGTLPWKDNGDRLLPRAMAMKFIDDHGALKARFAKAVEDFLDGSKYKSAIEQAQWRMGDLFNENDYPSVDQVRRKFYVHLDIDQVTPGKDIRLEDDTEILQARVTKAMVGLWARLAAPLEHFRDQLSKEDSIFRNATVLNLQEIVDLIPALNFTNDPQLDKIRKEIQENILLYDPDQLRTDKDARAWAVNSAHEILETVNNFVNAFGGT